VSRRSDGKRRNTRNGRRRRRHELREGDPKRNPGLEAPHIIGEVAQQPGSEIEPVTSRILEYAFTCGPQGSKDAPIVFKDCAGQSSIGRSFSLLQISRDTRNKQTQTYQSTAKPLRPGPGSTRVRHSPQHLDQLLHLADRLAINDTAVRGGSRRRRGA
jgi:hypothetical protein